MEATLSQALLFERLDDNKVRCGLCHHRCVIPENRRGICMVRHNLGGNLNSLVHNKAIARHVDPIEKKPLFHVLPGSLSYSVATVGCNFSCRFCQNSDIAQMPKDRNGLITGQKFAPRALVDEALAAKCETIAYTYTEPTVYFEYALETARLAHENHIKNVFVTNGYMTPEAVETIGPWLDAANVDLKAFNDAFYKDLVGAKRKHVLETLICLKKAGVFLEITTLLIPGANDDPAELKDLAGFIAESLGTGTPWHVSRFHPAYRLTDRPGTSVDALLSAREIGINAGLDHVYTGNIPGQGGENTHCPHCRALLIERMGYRIFKNRLASGQCPECGAPAHGIWA